MTATAANTARTRTADGRFAKRSLRAVLAKHSEQLAEDGPDTFEAALAAVEHRIRTTVRSKQS